MKKRIIIYALFSFSLVAQNNSPNANENSSSEKESKEEKVNKSKTPKIILVELPELEVITDKPFTAASSRRVRSKDLKLRSIVKPIDVLQVTPGLFAVQHAGGGKAPQYFIRGFDIDHGTDLALSADGMPINMVSHAHGQGYADVHFIIPEIYDELLVRKGPYFVDVGDFGTAGALEFKSKKVLKENSVSMSGGMFNSFRVLWQNQIQSDTMQPIMAVELHGSDAQFDNPEKLKRINLFFKNSFFRTSKKDWSVTAMAYSSAWNASGQIPERAVKSGAISRFGTIDKTEGGSTQRISLSSNYRQVNKNSSFEANAYLIRYNFSIFSNFTFYKDDRINGDQIAQLDNRITTGGEAKHTYYYKIANIDASTMFGGRMRFDDIENQLYRSKKRKLIQPKVNAKIDQSNLSGFIEEQLSPFPWLRFVGGLRAEYFVFKTNDLLEDKGSLNAATTSDISTSGHRDAALLLPKANLVISPLKEWDIYLNFGVGFHSNDARGINNQTSVTASPVAQAYGYEIGNRLHLFNRLDFAISGWLLDLDSEIVWVGDAGTTEASGRSRRYGSDIEFRLQILKWLYIDLDATINTANFRDNPGNANSVALAPRFTLTGGITVDHFSGFSGSLRARHIGKRPANETGTLVAKGFLVFDMALSYRKNSLEVFSNLQNITNTEWKEVQFATLSQLKSETNPVEEIHFVAGTPFYAEAGIRYYL